MSPTEDDPTVISQLDRSVSDLMKPLTRRGLVGAFAAVPVSRQLAARSLRRGCQNSPSPKTRTAGPAAGGLITFGAAGFPVEIVQTGELNQAKARLGVPRHLAACHTAEVEAYVLEGHVPAIAIRRLLAERPQIKGLAVPGMPVGSPGMEVKGTPAEPYDVIAFGPAGETRFARFKGADPV